MSDEVTVGDVRDDPFFGPALQREIDEINREGDIWEYNYCSKRGIPISKALWKRLKKWQRLGSDRRCS